MTDRLLFGPVAGRWILPASAAALTCVLLCSLLAGRHLLARDAEQVRIDRQVAQHDLESTSLSTAPDCAPEVTFARALPSEVSMEALVQSLHDSARTFGVTLGSVSGEPHPGTAHALATLDVNATLRGGYGPIKSTLAESLSRFPSGTVERLHMKRDGAGTPVVEEASVQIVFALRPPVDGLLDCRLSPAGYSGKPLSGRLVPNGSVRP